MARTPPPTCRRRRRRRPLALPSPPERPAEIISDIGGHRSGRDDARDGYQQLLRRLADPDIAGVAVYDLSRLARNIRLMLNLKHELDARNLRLIVSNLPRAHPSMTRSASSCSASSARLRSSRLTSTPSGMVGITRTKHERGGHNGSDPFGYRTVRDEAGRIVQPHLLEVEQEEAEVIRLIFDEYGREQHRSHGALASDLNARGVTRRGRSWNEKSVADILRRAPFYLGNAVYRRGEDIRPGTHDPIVTLEQAHATERVAVRRRRPGRYGTRGRTYLLQRLAYCRCGLRMRAETRRSRGKGWAYYVCPGRRDGRCAEPATRIEVADARVIEHLATFSSPPRSHRPDERRAEADAFHARRGPDDATPAATDGPQATGRAI